MKKKLLLLLSLVICMVCVIGCGKEASFTESTIDEEILTTAKNTTTYNFTEWVKSDFGPTIESEEIDEESRALYQSWQEMKDRFGDLTSQTEPEVNVVDDVITVKIIGEFQHGKMELTMTFANTGAATDLTINEIESKAKIMEKALMNTLMGMGTVFVVLILISLVISSFGLIGKSQAKKKAAEQAAKAEVAQPVVMSAPVVEEATDVTDDLELVAVITAAIMASMGDEAPAEGLVVRSIKKRNASKWKNA